MKSLDLTKVAMVPEKKVVELISAFDMLADIEAWMLENGCPAPRRPRAEMPDLSDIVDQADELSDLEMEKHLVRFAAWGSYMGSKLANLIAAHSIAESNRKAVAAELKLNLYAKKTPKVEADARVLASPRFQEFDLEERKLYCMKKILAARYEGATTGHSSISRLITLRGQVIDKSKVTTTVPRSTKRPNRRKTGFRS